MLPAFPATQLLSGFYLNELLLKLLTRGDPHPELFDLYEATLGELLAALTEDSDQPEWTRADLERAVEMLADAGLVAVDRGGGQGGHDEHGQAGGEAAGDLLAHEGDAPI